MFFRSIKDVLLRCHQCRLDRATKWSDHYRFNILAWIIWDHLHKVWKSCRQKKSMGVLVYLCHCEGSSPGNCCWSFCWRIFLVLRRFIARREKPQQIVLDNAPQLKLTKSSVDLALENTVRDPDVQSHISEQKIKWSFIAQLSPWMGGF